MKLKLFTTEIPDRFLRDNAQKTVEFVNKQPLLTGDFRIYEITITGNHTGLKFAHNLSFTPKDVIQTYAVFSGGVGALTWNYASFDSTFLNLTTSGMGASDTCVVRALIGQFL